MLKNIRLHLEKDEEKQDKLEASLAQSILETHHKNINSFARNIPSLSSLIKQPQLQNYSLFCNKHGEINIVDYGVGRTLYGFHPQQEILQQVNDFLGHAPYFSLSATNNEHSALNTPTVTPEISFETSRGYQDYIYQKVAPETLNCLVVLGCGLGLHILELMTRRTIKCLVIYEPEVQYFQCSILVNKWGKIFDLAKSKGTKIFIQVEKDGRNLISDINELVEYENIGGFYVMKHYNHPVFNSLLNDLRSKSWSELQENGVNFNFNESYQHYVPTWTPTITVNDYSSCQPTHPKLQQNLLALEKYFPEIFHQYKSYQPKTWLPIQNSEGQINIVKAESLVPWYSDSPKQDCLYNYEHYNEQPHKDGLVLGYKGTKLAHYLHYQFVKETEELLAKAEEETGALPENIASIIMFGLGVGYQLESLLENHTVEKIFLCEPNTDFFYASLFAIDWHHIFETVDKTDARIYLNVGDDGSHLFRDLLSQFHSIGPYILNNTYFYQSYYNASLNNAIAQLREQLQIVISMGEYFDHAYYGIEHTKEGFRRNIPVLTKKPADKLSFDDKEVPIFIIGNGPSLDLSIEAIKEWKDNAIVISCGTTLQSLHRHGITPDFHAEIEQNRSTYDWAVLIGNLEYLKTITLISCNGIHPDTCELYKDVLVAFKEGESSTVSAQSVLGRQNFETLQHAFPTVSNFVTDLMSVIGFNHIYLMGVDLGFIDVKHHHSKSSGYYQEDGKETYDYAENNNTSLTVPGNFRPRVNTKHEFKISKQIIEQVVHKKLKLQTFYNCSDGAKILGTNPLHLDNLLIVSSKSQKIHAIEIVKSVVFSTINNANFIERYESKFSHSVLIKELTKLECLLDQDVTSAAQANKLINKQKELLFSSYKTGKSLLFYYLYGTTNYANAVLSKMLCTNENISGLATAFEQTKAMWLDALRQIKQLINEKEPEDFDVSSFSLLNRQLKSLKRNCGDCSLLIVSDSAKFIASIKFVLDDQFSWIKQVKIISPLEIETNTDIPDYAIYHLDHFEPTNLRGSKNTIAIVKSEKQIPLNFDGITYLKNPVIKNDTVFNNPIFLARVVILACFNQQKCNLVLPKYRALQSPLLLEPFYIQQLEEYEIFDDIFYLSVFSKNDKQKSKSISISGSRSKKIISPLKIKHLVYQLMSESAFNEHKQTIKNLLDAKIRDDKN
ncbi:6-hydroxymethylpterin diphosphokinase MptE-like protein [Paraglaciecola sp. 25GB23A]|uniref:6-hydroxymethylpterin diphosphokinase MptE-like protein n=1 Tax=Paraglaciecola sp. 25GB23A TaxID=3156068 RepID=UPI0032AFF76C